MTAEQFCFESMDYIGSIIPVTASMATVGARRLKVLEDENAKLKKLLAEQMLDNAILKDIALKNVHALCQAECRGSRVRSARCQPASGV